MSKSKRDYLFQRDGSQHWWIRLRSPTGRIEKSLGTPDRREAEIKALPMIAEHKAALLVRRPHIFRNWVTLMEPGREHVAEDGHRIIATERELIHVNADGTTRTEPNGSMGWTLTTGYPVTENDVQSLAAVATGKAHLRPTLAKKNGDDALFDTYLDHGGKKKTGIHGYYRAEAESVWALYKRLTDNKPLKDATREDGRKLTVHFKGEGLKNASIQKKLMWLTAAVNLAIKEGRLQFNPFAGIAPQRDDETERLPLDDADMQVCKHNLDKLSESDQLLFRVLATTGMRLREAFEIGQKVKVKIKGEWQERTNSDKIEKGCRFVIVGHKTAQSKRRVPLPADVLPYLPKSIKGPLFEGNAPAASKRLNLFLNDCGIVDPCKVVHSLRHRAQDRLRAAGCPQDVRWELLGHEKKTVSANYGEGSPVPMLKRWIDKIGF